MTAPGRRAALAVLGSAPAAACWAHMPENTPDSVPAWTFTWSFDPWVVAPLLLSAALYALGIARLWSRAGRGRGISMLQATAFAGGWSTLAAALVSPLDALGGQLFSAHMLQHELLMVLAAPLLCLAQPLAAWTWALPAAARRALAAFLRCAAWRWAWRGLTAPLTAWALHAVVLWGWHAPALFEAALADTAWHTWQHGSFLASALLFWWAVLRPGQRQGAAGMAYVFTTMLHTAFLGALLSLSNRIWYPGYLSSTPALGLDPLADQQLGGLLMWVPAGLAYLVSGLALAARWMTDAGPPQRATASALPPGCSGDMPATP